MINLILSGITYRYPVKQSELSYSMGKQLESIIEDYPDFNNNIEGKKFFLAMLLCVDYDIVDKIDDEQISILVDNHSYFQPSVLNIFPKHIKINKKIYKYQDFDSVISVERFAELDQLAMDKDEEGLFRSLYHPVKKKINHLWLRNYKSIDDMNYYAVKLSIYYYYQWKQNLLNEYNLNYENKNIPKEQQSDTIKLKDVEKFGIYHILLSSTNDDYDKMVKWLNRDIRELLKYLLYIRIKSIDEK